MLSLFNGTSELRRKKLVKNNWTSYEHNYHKYFSKFLKVPLQVILR